MYEKEILYFCIFSPHIAQCVGKRRVMSVKKFSASFFSRKSAAGILAKSEVFAPATSTCRGDFHPKGDHPLDDFCNFSSKRKVNP